MNILIADDHTGSRKLLRDILEAEGHEVIEAFDGRQALVFLQGCPVDAIVSDNLMPNMDGYRLCYEVRQNEHLRQLPFIVYTATYVTPGDVKLSHELGADVFLRKPASAAEIVSALETSTHAPVRAASKLPLDNEEAVLKEYNAR